MNNLSTLNIEKFFKGTSNISQFSVYWVSCFDKRRPGIIISNDWYNMSTQQVLVAPMTSRDKSFSGSIREYSELYIPYISASTNTKTVNYIDLSTIKSINYVHTPFSKGNFIGVLTDRRVRQKIINMMSNIMNPDYNADHLSLEYQIEHRLAETYDEPTKQEVYMLTHTDHYDIPDVESEISDIIETTCTDTIDVDNVEPIVPTVVEDVEITNVAELSDDKLECTLPIKPNMLHALCEEYNLEDGKLAAFNLMPERKFTPDMCDQVMNALLFILNTKDFKGIPGLEHNRTRGIFLTQLISAASKNKWITEDTKQLILQYRNLKKKPKPNFIDFVDRHASNN